MVLSVMHVLWECAAYSSRRLEFLEKLQKISGDRCSDFDTLTYRLTPGYEAVPDIPEAVYSTTRGVSRGR